jgi:tRNA G18 (ribose-2'-O)-methylase SpoU
LPSPISVTDPADPRIAAYRDIREGDLVGRQGRFIAEGKVVLEVLLTASRHQILSLLIAENRFASLAPLLAGLAGTVPVFSASQAVLNEITGFHLHRGILALGQRAPLAPAAELLSGLGPKALIVMLFGIANHDNMGGIFRNAAAFGADAVILDPHCCDPLYRKAIRVSVGGSLVVPFARLAPDEDPLALLACHHVEAIALSPGGRQTLAGLRRPPRVAVLLGAEGPGLPAALLARTQSACIPMAAGFDSLNVATTCGIVLHHLVSEPPHQL